MENNRWSEIEYIFAETLELPEADRAAFIAQACNGNQTLQREVESLLAAHQQAKGFLAPSAAPLSAKQFLPGSLAITAAHRIGPYQLRRELGQGGMGTVWLAERADEQYKQQVAIKLIKAGANNPDIAHRLRHERQILADLNHPNIARLLDGGTTDNGQPYLVMEYIEGVPIDEYCQQQQLPLQARLQLFRQVCSAVQYAHQHLIIHRDLKPANILVAADGTPKLLDFGIAKLLQPDLAQSYQTQAGQTPMTPAYASPEQVRSETLTTTSDVYSLGVVLYELLTGHSPYQLKEKTFNEMMRAICEQEPTRPSLSRKSEFGSRNSEGERTGGFLPTSDFRIPTSSLRGDLDSIVLKSLRKEPQARYSSVEQLSDDIQRYLDGLPTLARKGSFTYRAVKYVRRYKVPVAAAALILLSLLGGIGATSRQAQIARAEQAKAEAERIRAEQALAVADEQRHRAEQALAEVEAQRTRAETALSTAEQRRKQAEAARTEATQQRTEAEAQKAFADEQRTRAEKGEETKRQLLYGAQVKLAQQAWDSADVERMRELLDAHLPQPGHSDLRGFEWYYLWRLAHSDLVTLNLGKPVWSIAVTPDGAKVAAQPNGGDLRIWDTATGKELAPIHDPEANALFLSISPDGKFLAQTKLNKQIKIFDVSNGAQLSTLEFGQAGSISTFSPDGKLFAAATTDGTVSVWSVPTWKQQVSFKAFSDVVTAIVFTPDSKQLLTSGREILVKVWNPFSGQELRTISVGTGITTMGMAFIPGTNNIVSSHSRSGGLKIWDFVTGKQIAEIKNTPATGGLSCSPDGKMIATGHYDKVVRLWSAKSGALLTEIKTHSGPLKAVAFTPDSKGLFTGGEDKTLKFRNVQEVSDARLLAHNPAYFHNVAFTHDGSRLITGDDAQIARIHDPNTGTELDKLEGHLRLPLALNDPVAMIKVAVSPTGGYFASSGYDGTVRTWDEKTGKPLHVFDAHTRGLYGVTISADGRYIASGGSDTLVRVWDTVTGRELHTLRGHARRISAAAFSPQGKYLATCDEQGVLKLWDYVRGVELCTLRPAANSLRNLAFSPDGNLLALGDDDRQVLLLDTATWRTVKTLKGHTQYVTSLEFSPDGKRLVAGGRDNTTRVWELGQGQEVLTLRGHGNMVMDIAFSPDGNSLVTVGSDGKMLLWPMATPREVFARSSSENRPLRADVSADAIGNLFAVQPSNTSLTALLKLSDQKINGWSKGDTASEQYAVLVDSSVSLSHKASALIVVKGTGGQETTSYRIVNGEGRVTFPGVAAGSLTQAIRADQFRGRRVRFSGYLKSLELGKLAQLWLRVEGAEHALEFGEITKAASTDWLKYEVALNVPEDSLILHLGFDLINGGQLWGDDFRFEVVDDNVLVTSINGYREQMQKEFLNKPEEERARLEQRNRENAKKLPLKPVNLDFEQ